MARVVWEEIRVIDDFGEKYFVCAERTQVDWHFSDRSTFGCVYHSLEQSPDLVAIAERGLRGDIPDHWVEFDDLGAESLKRRAQRNRRLLGRLRIRFSR